MSIGYCIPCQSTHTQRGRRANDRRLHEQNDKSGEVDTKRHYSLRLEPAMGIRMWGVRCGMWCCSKFILLIIIMTDST
jgi:hypothetical protein